MSSIRQLKVLFDSFDDLVDSIAPGLSRTHLFARTDEVIEPGTRVRLEIGTVHEGAAIRGVAKIAGPAEEGSESGLHLHIIHLDPSSTRLVDSIVRGETAVAGAQEASGPSPFDIAPSEPVPEVEDARPKALESSPPAGAGRLRRLAWPLVLIGLAGAFLLVFELFFRHGENPLLTGRDRQTGPVDPATESDETEAESLPLAGELIRPIEVPPAEDKVSEVAPGDEPAPEPAALAEDVAKVVEAWATAWSRQDPVAYLELYAPDYSPAGLDRDAWERQRRARITAPERLEVDVSDLVVEIVDAERAIARFQQLYVSDEKNLAARKVLELERSAAGWEIVAERLER